METENYVVFENMTEKFINLTIDWTQGIGETYTEIRPKDKAEIVFNDDTALICHRSDGGSPDNCEETALLAVRGDYFQLYEDGVSQVKRHKSFPSKGYSVAAYRVSDVEPIFYDRFIKEGITLRVVGRKIFRLFLLYLFYLTRYFLFKIIVLVIF
ncbi:hypothetical protein, partial [Flavobacterium collinsii]|uniref:hypothetical protein n=1 Tax=Flavobacterium collinsii TaxID=1114861 RepID=UPI001570C8A4